VQDFKGVIEVAGCTISQNMVNIPDIFEPVSEHEQLQLSIDHKNLNYFLNGNLNLYELAKCESGTQDRYLLRDGIEPYLRGQYGVASLFNEFERHAGAVYIS